MNTKYKKFNSKCIIYNVKDAPNSRPLFLHKIIEILQNQVAWVHPWDKSQITKSPSQKKKSTPRPHYPAHLLCLNCKDMVQGLRYSRSEVDKLLDVIEDKLP